MGKELLGSVELNRIYQMDCLLGMELIPDNSVDMILCDLPYGITSHRETWDKILPVENLWKQYKRIIKDNCAIVLTAVNPIASILINSNIEMFKYEWIWEKDNGSNFPSVKFQPFRVHELILVFSSGNITYNKKENYMNYYPQMVIGEPYKRFDKGGSVSNYTDSKCTLNRFKEYSSDGKRYPRSVLKFKRERGLHPTQKPVDLFQYLIETYTTEGSIVLDSCMGSGTTAVASIKSGRRFVGFETEPKYIEIANERIKTTLC